MRKFEIPFNHEELLLNFLERNADKLLNYINHIFVAPYIKDLKSTRHIEAKKPIDRDVYESQIHRLQKSGYKVCILLNNENNVITNQLLHYYINKLHINSFIINSDEVAKYIKDKYKNITTIASITKLLSYNDIVTKDYSFYDYIVLPYKFNASLSSISKLPKRNKYIIMVNTNCDYNCDFKRHWYKESNFVCPRIKNRDRNITVIYPKDFNLFDPYISIYKLEGREYTSTQIISDIMYYVFENPTYTPTIKIDEFISSSYYERSTNQIIKESET